jgi:hypothetical protein
MERSRVVRDMESEAEALLASIERGLAEIRATEEPQDVIAEIERIVVEIRAELRRFVDQESSPLK